MRNTPVWFKSYRGESLSQLVLLLSVNVPDGTLYNFSALQYVYICKNIKDFISSLSSAFIKLKPHV